MTFLSRNAGAAKKGRPTNIKKAYARADVELSGMVNDGQDEAVDD